jgi:hypothetical protein
MTKLKVDYEQGAYPVCEIVTVASDEEYWFENPGTAACSLSVGPRWLAPFSPGVPLEEIQNAATVRPRLHIFNLARIEVIE